MNKTVLICCMFIGTLSGMEPDLSNSEIVAQALMQLRLGEWLENKIARATDNIQQALHKLAESDDTDTPTGLEDALEILKHCLAQVEQKNLIFINETLDKNRNVTVESDTFRFLLERRKIFLESANGIISEDEAPIDENPHDEQPLRPLARSQSDPTR